MTHIVMYKFPEGEYKDEYKEQAELAFSKVKAETKGVQNVFVFSSCVKRDVNFDLMVAVEVIDEAALKEYLSNPNHKAFSKEMDKYIINKARFDFDGKITKL